MLSAIGAAASAIELFKSLTSPKTSPKDTTFGATTSASSQSSSAASVASAPPRKGNVSPETMSALLDAQSQSTAASSTTTSAKSQSKALKDLFNLIDANGDGSVTKSEFEDALGAGGTNTANADSVFGKMDTDGDGKVSLDEMAAALKSGKSKRAHHTNPPVGEQTDPLLKALDEANAASAEARKASSSYASVGQVVRQQTQVSAARVSTLSVSA